MKLQVFPYELRFKEPGGTSRGVMLTRKVWFFVLSDPRFPDRYGIGECAPLPGLSCDDMSQFEAMLKQVIASPIVYLADHLGLQDYPSIRFGLELAWLDLTHQGKRVWFPSEFTEGNAGIPINGLIWMGTYQEMSDRIKQKLNAGFKCLKLKIGAIDFESELALLKALRKTFSAAELELRVDANGAFSFAQAPRILSSLAKLHIHSIEQPIKAGQWEEMALLCASSPLPIVLDEELIGLHTKEMRRALLTAVRPQYLILKPSLIGGFSSSDEWIALAEEHQVDWWITSALESNVGLNALAQWSFAKKKLGYHGLGTGQIFTNNLQSNLELRGDKLFLNPSKKIPDEVVYLRGIGELFEI